jgi:hypothetical protein
LHSLSKTSLRQGLSFCRVGKQKAKLSKILIGYQGHRKSSCAYV